MLEFLEKYEFLATWAELFFFVIVFICFERKRLKKEKELDIQEKIKAIISRIYESLLVYLGDQKTKNKSMTKKQMPSFLKYLFAQYAILKTIPKEFYDDIFFGNLFLDGKPIADKDMVNAISFLQGRSYVYNTKGTRLLIFNAFFQEMRKYFKNDKEIEEIYNNLNTLRLFS